MFDLLKESLEDFPRASADDFPKDSSEVFLKASMEQFLRIPIKDFLEKFFGKLLGHPPEEFLNETIEEQRKSFFRNPWISEGISERIPEGICMVECLTEFNEKTF